MLFHVVGTGELLGASRIGTWNSFLCCMNLGMAGGVAGGGKGLLTSMSIPVAARESLPWSIIGGSM